MLNSTFTRFWGIVVLCFATVHPLSAQICDHPSPPQEQMDQLVRSIHAHQPLQSLQTNASGDYLVNLIILTDGNGGNFNGQSYPSVLQAIHEGNTYLASSGISLALDGSPTYIDDSVMYNAYGIGIEFIEWAQEHDKPGYINFYTKNYPGTSTAYSNYPGYANRQVYGSISGKVVAHEVGHYYSLFHTFGGSLFGLLTEELVDGSNCTTTGDWICDTPADPYPKVPVDPFDCQYNSTFADANGDIYQPLTDNIMSYYPIPCWENFTNGQITRMQEVAIMDRAYLRQDPNPFEITYFPHQLCEGDSTQYQLTGSDPNGIFSGPGIANNVLNISQLSAGLYSCTYAGTSPKGDTILVVDAAQTLYNFWASVDTTYIWQAYVPTQNKDLEQISLRLSNDSATTITINIHDGEGDSGLILYTETFPLAADSFERWVDFSLASSLTQVQGQPYTISATSSTAGVAWAVGDTLNTTPQLNSSVGLGPAYPDYFSFATWVEDREGSAPDSITFTFHVSAAIPNSYYQFEFADQICKDQAPMELSSVLRGYYKQINYLDSFQVNGMRDTLIRPQLLGAGEHEVSFIYKDYDGCVIELVDTFSIADFPAILLPDSLCLEGSPLDLSAIHPDGAFQWNGKQDSIFDPAIEGPGVFDIEIHLPNTIDTTHFRAFPQVNAGGMGDRVKLGESYGQSFKADSSAQLDTIQWLVFVDNFLAGNSDRPTVAFSIRDGEGLNQPLMHSDTILIDSLSFIRYKLLWAKHQILLQKDSVYTLEVSSVDLPPTVSFSIVRLNGVSPNPAGISYIKSLPDSTQDLNVEVWQREPISCGEDQVHQLVVSETSIDAIVGDTIAYLTDPGIYSVSASPNHSYQWTVTGGQILSGQGSATISVQWTGTGTQTISVEATNSLGCISELRSREFMVLTANSLTGEIPLISWDIFPNPATAQVSIRFSADINSTVDLIVIDQFGREVVTQSHQLSVGKSDDVIIQTSQWARGMYQVVIRSGDHIASKTLALRN